MYMLRVSDEYVYYTSRVKLYNLKVKSLVSGIVIFAVPDSQLQTQSVIQCIDIYPASQDNSRNTD